MFTYEEKRDLQYYSLLSLMILNTKTFNVDNSLDKAMYYVSAGSVGLLAINEFYNLYYSSKN